jgi:transcriptional regulator with GAF, ATPase, and Fis domain
MVARAIHEASPRAGKALVPVECSSLPESLFESELFGHERGAFTGASGARAGLVEAASGGTLFLDEVGDIPLSMQVKLLRLLEAGTYRRVGSNEIRHADIRVVAATHRDLVSMVRQGRFREDLYYRLATFPVHLPPLRERHGDLPLLAEALLQRIDPQRPRTLAPAALQALMAYDYPGNVRELRNVLERAVLLSDQPVLDADTVREAIDAGRIGLRREPVPAPPTAADPVAPGDTPVADWRTREVHALREAVQRHRGTRAELARQLGMSERTLYRKLKALGLASTGGSDRP